MPIHRHADVPQARDMTTHKLFQVLVVGGALLGAGCREEGGGTPDAGAGGDPDAPPPTGDDAGLSDAALPTDATMTLPDIDGGGDPVECGFCPNPECCETGADGVPREMPGFVCCWGTSCASE